MAVQLQTLDPVTVVSAGTAYPLSAVHTAVTSVTIQAEFTNVSKLVVGASNVSSANGVEVPPGDTALIMVPERGKASDEFFLDEIFITSTTSGDKARIVAWRRKP